MPPKKSRPGRGGVTRVQQFGNVRVPTSLKTWYAWMAGEPEWYECHEHTKHQRGTKICLDWATDGALHCPRCKPFTTTSTIAYVPMYREVDHKECLVICHESVSDLLAELVYGTFVMVGRVSDDASIFVKKSTDQPTFRTENEQRKFPCNLTPTLLTLWGYPQYDQWLVAQGKYVNRGPLNTTEPVPTKSDGKPVKAEYAAAMRRWSGGADAVPMDGVIGDVVEEATKRSAHAEKNGKHDKKG